MAIVGETVRQSLTLPVRTVRRVEALAAAQHTTTDEVLAGLIEAGLESRHYADLVDRLASTADPSERKKLKEELALLTFGE